jgi:putative radical SAM enzyme (TIGR03279 family)
MSAPRVVSVAAASPAQRAGLRVGDELLSIDGRVPRDVIEYRLLVDEADPELEVRRGHEQLTVHLAKEAGGVPGIEVSSAVFDRIRTCDNHCEFCFIYQLPKGMRRSLYLKDDDYRLSFLYGNFTTLTRFTELDLERVLTERLSPLFVSIHATDPALRARMLRNPRGATSLRWLRALLDGGIEVHGQIVVCPGVNDGPALDATLAGILDEYPDLATAACVPLGVSDHTPEAAMRPHTTAEAAAVIDTVEQYQELCRAALGRRLVYAADEYYLLAGRPFPPVEAYDGFPQHENGIGMARAFEAAFGGDASAAHGVRPGFFAWVDGAPGAGYRAPRVERGTALPADGASDEDGATDHAEEPAVAILTGEYGAAVLEPVLGDRLTTTAAGSSRPRVRLVPVANRFFGGNIAVTGLITGADVARVLAGEPAGDRYLLPDVCLSEGRFLDGTTPADLPRPVEVVPSDGSSLRRALDGAAAALAAPRVDTGGAGPVRVPVSLRGAS